MENRFCCFLGMLVVLSPLGARHQFFQERAIAAPGPAAFQDKSGSHQRITTQQSITVSAPLTPEEKEDGDLNDVYQPIYLVQEAHDCSTAIEKYQSVVIPKAEVAKFSKPKNKFLYLAYRGIADCDMQLTKFSEAEAIYQKLFDYIPVWPGTDDSDYPIAFRSLGYSRMAQQRWSDAEEPLKKSVSTFDDMIASASSVKEDSIRDLMTNNYRMSQDTSLYYLAVVYFRESRNEESLALLERAYNQAEKYNAPAPLIKNIVDAGVAVSIGSVNLSAGATWSKRALTLK